jgi:hypothetical protein
LILDRDATQTVVFEVSSVDRAFRRRRILGDEAVTLSSVAGVRAHLRRSAQPHGFDDVL